MSRMIFESFPIKGSDTHLHLSRQYKTQDWNDIQICTSGFKMIHLNHATIIKAYRNELF